MEKLSTLSFSPIVILNRSKGVYEYDQVVSYLKKYALKYNDIFSNNIINMLNPYIYGDEWKEEVYVDRSEVELLFKMVNYIHDMNDSIIECDKKDSTYENLSYIKGQRRGLDDALNKFYEIIKAR